MSGGYYGGGPEGISLRVPVGPMARKIIYANIGVYLVTMLALVVNPDSLHLMAKWLFLVNEEAIGKLHVWTWFTYGWLHDFGPNGAMDPSLRMWPLWSMIVCGGAIWGIVELYRSRKMQSEFFLFLILAFAIITFVGYLNFSAPMHVLGNMLTLYFFSHLFEKRWGGRRFLVFWVLCVVAGGVLSTLMWYVLPAQAGGAVIGASGGAVGLVAAYAMYYPNQTILYGLMVPIKGKHMLLILALFDGLLLLASLIRQSSPGVAVFAHFGGMAMGILLTTGYWRPSKLSTLVGSKKPRKRKKGPNPNHLRLVPPPDEDDEDDDRPRYLH